MEQVSRLVEGMPGKSTSFIDDHVKGKRTAIFAAVQVLVEEGFIRAEEGTRNSQLHYSNTRYRQADDPQENGSDDRFPTSSPTGSPTSGRSDDAPASPDLFGAEYDDEEPA
jgi:hypothetical protein